jgi:hypothetical protein
MIDECLLIEDKIETRGFWVQKRSDDIIVFTPQNVEEINVEYIRLANEASAKLSGGKASLNLVVLKDFLNTTPEARVYAASEESNKYTIADAFVIQSQALKIVANFYLKFNKPTRPTRIFNTEESAIEWLNTYRQ